jgi:Domain of unknown function (DUF4326)
MSFDNEASNRDNDAVWEPKVLNMHDKGVKPSETAVYVGRPSKWGNPFAIGGDWNREQVISKYKDWFENQDLVFQLEELRGKDLICWCAPEACHADWLLLLANADMTDWLPTPPKEREPEWHRGYGTEQGRDPFAQR